jgi:malonyl-CoA O-methyltransferase
VYDTDGNPLVGLEEREFDGVLGAVAGLDVLDLGCGTGRHALRLASRGACVTALDLSEGMLAKARAKLGAEQVRFVLHDAQRALPFESASFDRVVSGLVLEHVRDLEAFFREVRRVLRPRGVAVISTLHPALALKGVSARFEDGAGCERVHVESRPQSISEIVMATLGAGFELELVSEHAPDAGFVACYPRAEKHLGWPMLLLLRVRAS